MQHPLGSATLSRKPEFSSASAACEQQQLDMASLEDKDKMATCADTDDVPVTNGIWRSTRARKVPSKYDEEYIIPSEKPSETEIIARPDRPKRRAAEAARKEIVPEDIASLQEQIFARMDIDERKEYRGWVELESEPVSLKPSCLSAF